MGTWRGASFPRGCQDPPRLRHPLRRSGAGPDTGESRQELRAPFSGCWIRTAAVQLAPQSCWCSTTVSGPGQISVCRPSSYRTVKIGCSCGRSRISMICALCSACPTERPWTCSRSPTCACIATSYNPPSVSQQWPAQQVHMTQADSLPGTSTRLIGVPGCLSTPAHLAHRDAYVPDDPDALVFASVRGRPLRRSSFNRTVNWAHARAIGGVPNVHPHELRHTDGTRTARRCGPRHARPRPDAPTPRKYWA